MVRLIVYNIEYCEGMTGKWYDYLKFWRMLSSPPDVEEKLIGWLKKKNPDILALIEVDRGSLRSRFEDIPQFIEHKLGFTSMVDFVKYPFVSFLRVFHFLPVLREQSNALLSKYPLFEVKHHLLHEGTKRVIIEASVKCPRKLTLFVAHLALGTKTRKKQLEELAELIRKKKNPVILMGDFNVFHGRQELDYLIKKTHLNDTYELDYTRIKFTEPAYHPTRRLDYILVSNEIKVKDYEILKAEFSDHLPVLLDFSFKK
ncbi:endonuclease/exonuclease/phosphatase family protein [Candidatus Woesearchaeota archaeon]|nr:endonuclease/exonuclease/phosphatase family protein [Candidatus Woesearchaeota archaeon]